MSGPATEDIPKMAPMTPIAMGLLCRGRMRWIVTVPPVKMPQNPKPATAHPIIKATEFGAAPQITDPISKRDIAVIKTHLGE
jgi:hypothetical protein